MKPITNVMIVVTTNTILMIDESKVIALSSFADLKYMAMITLK